MPGLIGSLTYHWIYCSGDFEKIDCDYDRKDTFPPWEPSIIQYLSYVLFGGVFNLLNYSFR